MSDSSDSRRRVTEVHVAQCVAQARRYRLEDGGLTVAHRGARYPELEVEPGIAPWPEPVAMPDASCVPDSTLLSSLRQAIASETWQPAEERPAEERPAPQTPLPGPMPRWGEYPAVLRQQRDDDTGEPVQREDAPDQALLPGRPQRQPTDRHARTSAAMAAFDAGLREAAPPPAFPLPDLPHRADPAPWQAVHRDDTVAPAPRQRVEPLVSEAALAFAAGAGEMASLPAVALSLPIAAHRAPPPARPAALAGPGPVAEQAALAAVSQRPVAPAPNRAAVDFEAGAREMAAVPPRGVPVTPPAPDRAELPVPPQPQLPSPQPPLQPQPQPQPQPQLAPRVVPHAPDGATTAFDAGALEGAALQRRRPEPPPHAEAPVEFDERSEPARDVSADEDAPDGVDALQSAQQALDGRLAQLTFRGIVANGAG